MKFNFNKTKYIAVMVLKEQTSFKFITTKILNPLGKKDFVYKDKKYPNIDYSKPTYIKGLNNYYFLEIKEGQICLETADLPVDTELLDLFTSKRIFTNILSSFNTSNFGKRIFDILFGSFIGIVIGIFIGVFLP